MKYSLKGISFFILLLITSELAAEDGYRLWLRYDPITDTTVLKQYNKVISGWKVEGGIPRCLRYANSLVLKVSYHVPYVEKPEHDLEYYKKYRYSDIPGIR